MCVGLVLRKELKEGIAMVDFYTWTQTQAVALREGNWSAVDVAVLAEEVEDMGKSDFAKVANLMKSRMAHLLKWKYQSSKRCRSWRDTIIKSLLEIEDEFDYSPSLRRKLIADLPSIYRRAARLAVVESGLPESTFPEICPFSEGDLFDVAFFSEESAARSV